MTRGEFVFAVIHPEMLIKAQIDQAVITAPAIGMDHAFHCGLAADNGLQRGFSGIRHDLSVDTAVALQQTEHDSFAGGATSAFATHPTRAEVGFVGLKLAGERRNLGAFFSEATTQTKVDIINRAHQDAGQLRCIGRGQIQPK